MVSTKDPIQLVSEALECDPESLIGSSGLGRHPKWDSMAHVTIMIALENHYKIQISDDTIRQFEKMEEIIKFFNEINSTRR